MSSVIVMMGWDVHMKLQSAQFIAFDLYFLQKQWTIIIIIIQS